MWELYSNIKMWLKEKEDFIIRSIFPLLAVVFLALGFICIYLSLNVL